MQCILSHLQQHIIRKVMKRQELDCLFNDDEGSIEILKAYDMQGIHCFNTLFLNSPLYCLINYQKFFSHRS